jgi:bifunctional non-homologous end joining protein LigD
MLLTAAKKPFDDPAWTYQLKYDGWRLLAMTTSEGAFLRTRGGGDATRWFPEVGRGLEELPPERNIFDGEVCVLDAYGRPDFPLLHARAQAKGWRPNLSPVVYCIFDILMHAGRDLRALPLKKRRVHLANVMARPASSLLHVTGVDGEGAWLFDQAKSLEVEGIVAKRLDSPYSSGDRSRDWLKIKRQMRTAGFKRDPMSDPFAK